MPQKSVQISRLSIPTSQAPRDEIPAPAMEESLRLGKAAARLRTRALVVATKSPEQRRFELAQLIA